MRSGLASILCVFSLLAGCGGGDGGTPPPTSNNPPPPPPPPVIGTAGGTITETSGASVVVPAGAITADTTFRIARDSTGAPVIPAELTAVGSMYVITPHGGDFAQPVKVRIPAPSAALQPNQQYKLAKAQPGGPWEVLGESQLTNGNLEADVRSFSFFMVVRVDYLLPILQTPPIAVTSSSLTCANGPCTNQLRDVTATYTVSTNSGGQFPSTCVNPTIVIANGNPGLNWPSIIGFTAVPLGGGSLTMSVTNNRNFKHSFGTGYLCDGRYFYNLGDAHTHAVTWLKGPAYPGISLVDMPAELDVAEGYPADVAAIFHGGAAREAATGFPPPYFPPTADDRATIDWQRSDDGGSSWRVVARSYQHEGNPLPYGTGPEWRPWSVRHRFIATATDQGALIRAHACYTPPAPAVAPPPCVVTPATRINVLQQNGIPVIATTPRSVLVRTGQTANLSASVTGLPAPSLRWQTRVANSNGAWSDVTSGTGATSANYTTAATAVSDNGTQYRILATNAVGSAASAAVTVSVSDLDVAPTITTQPANLSVASGGDAAFAVDARGTEALGYQWYRNGTALAGANSPVLRLTGVTNLNSGSFTVTVSNNAGDADSNAAILNVYPGAPAAVAPSIVTQPAPVTANAGSTATFAVGVDGTGPFTFQWRRDGVNITGATSAVLTFNSVSLPNAGTFSVVVTNAAGSATSNNAVLDVVSASTATAPTITSQPSTLIVPFRGSGVVAVGATGSGPLSYQWSRNGEVMPGAILPVLDFRTVAEQDAGTYTVTVSNSVGSVVSRTIDIILLGAPVITQQPADVTALEGENAHFFVMANSSGLRYQWFVNGNPIPGAIAATWNAGPVVTANSGAVYSVMVYNAAGHVFSQGAVLTVPTVVAPGILSHPANSTVASGIPADLCLTIGGTPTFDVLLQRWNGAAWVSGASMLVNDNANHCYSTERLLLADNGAQFRFLVTNPAGQIASTTATVNVVTSEPGIHNTTLVSEAIAGGPPNNISFEPSMSADGNLIAFISDGTNVHSDATLITGNAYVRNMTTGETRLINYNVDGDGSELGVYNVKLSSNGRYAIFSSRAGDLVPGDTNNAPDVFRRDLETGTTERVSTMADGSQLEFGVGGNGDYQIDISANGQIVMFLSGTNLITGAINNGYFLYYRNLQSGFMRFVAGDPNYSIAYSALSDDGETIAYAYGIYGNGDQTIQAFDIEASATWEIYSFPQTGGNGLGPGISVSSNGRYIAFSIRSTLYTGSPHFQVVVRDRHVPGVIDIASMKSGVPGDADSGWPEISGDGRYVAFSTIAPSLTDNLATPSRPHVVLGDVVDHTVFIASTRREGDPVWAGAFVNGNHALSEDGDKVAFVSDTLNMGMGSFGAQVFATPRP